MSCYAEWKKMEASLQMLREEILIVDSNVVELEGEIMTLQNRAEDLIRELGHFDPKAAERYNEWKYW